MKNGFTGVLITTALILGGIFYLNKQTELSSGILSSCSEPLTYRIGEIDERFGVTENEIKYLMEEVSEIWSEAKGSSVIEFDESGEIVLNFIYAEQQQLTDSERQFRDRLRSEEQSISVGEREFKQLNERFNEMESRYKADSNHLQSEIEELNSWVNRKNNEGGFNEQEIEVFETRKREIDLKAAELNRRALQLQQEAERVNREIDRLNRRIDEKNMLILEYNQTFTGTNRFTQGSYEYIGNRKRINIYQFSHRDELRLVMAHEVGHALGIGHVENPQSVMYHLMGNQNLSGLSLSTEDTEALQAVCSQ